MSGKLSFEELKPQIADGKIDTVLACIVDMQGRLMGKCFHAVNFVRREPLLQLSTGEVYQNIAAPEVPRSLLTATETLRASTFLREVLGDDVVDHYTCAAE